MVSYYQTSAHHLHSEYRYSRLPLQWTRSPPRVKGRTATRPERESRKNASTPSPAHVVPARGPALAAFAQAASYVFGRVVRSCIHSMSTLFGWGIGVEPLKIVPPSKIGFVVRPSCHFLISEWPSQNATPQAPPW